MQRKLFAFVARIYLPLLPGDAEPANAGTPKLKPVAALVQHQGRILVIVLLRLGLHILLVIRGVLLLVFSVIIDGECRLKSASIC